MKIDIRPEDGGYVLRAVQRLPARRDEVFPFFAAAENLEQITPAILRFRVVTPRPIVMREGALIDYRLRLRGLPIRWRSEITCWEPPVRFVDEQRVGPYRRWVHEHRFTEEGDATLVEDRVAYAVPGGRLVHALVVRRDVERIFAFRASALAAHFAAAPDA